MTYPFTGSGGNLTGLCVDMLPVTPSDDADVVDGKAVFVTCKGSAGNIVVTTVEGTDRTYPITANEVVPVAVTRVKATGTTATTIWAFVP